MTTSLTDLVATMLSDVKSGKAQAQAKQQRKKKLPGTKNVGVALKPFDPRFTPIKNPFINEAIVLLTNQFTCNCGAVHTSPNPNLFLEKTRLVHNHPETILSTIHANNALNLYKELETRTITRTYTTEVCQTCFIPSSNSFAANQISLPFPFNLDQETIQ